MPQVRSEPYDFVDLDDDSDSDVPRVPPPLAVRLQSSHRNTTEIKPLVLTPDDYVVVQVKPTGKRGARTVYYVGSVVGPYEDEGFEVKCMRRWGTPLNQFVYPLHEDVAVYSKDDILCVLHPPKVA